MFPYLFIFMAFDLSVAKVVEVESENLTDYLSVDACKDKGSLIGSDRFQSLEVVEAPLGGRLKLQCHYCDEVDDFRPKTWLKESRFKERDIKEVDLGMGDVLSDNRIYMKVDHTLVMSEVGKEDSAIYFCSQTPWTQYEADFKFAYLVDVVNKTKNVTIGKLSDVTLYEKSAYHNASDRFQASNRSDFVRIRNMGINMTVRLDWHPWTECDGCRKIRTKTSSCRLESNIINNITNQPGTDENWFLHKSYEMSCYSLEFEKFFPDISQELLGLKTWLVTEACFGPCKFQVKSDSLPRYKNTLLLVEGDHLTLACPETDGTSEVTWRRDGVQIDPFSKGENIMIDAFGNLLITYATDDESGNYTCFLGRVRMQEIIIVVRPESVVASPDFARYSIYLGFMLFLNFMLCISGIVMSYKRRHSFEKVDFEQYERELEPLRPEI